MSHNTRQRIGIYGGRMIVAAVAGHYEFGASRRHFEFREVEGCGAMAGGLWENASRILQISASKDAGTTLEIMPLSSLVSRRSCIFLRRLEAERLNCYRCHLSIPNFNHGERSFFNVYSSTSSISSVRLSASASPTFHTIARTLIPAPETSPRCLGS